MDKKKLKSINNFDIRQCEPVFKNDNNPRANIRAILANLYIDRIGKRFFVICKDKNEKEFVNILDLKEAILFIFKYYKGCICSVEQGLKGLSDIAKN